MSENHLYRRYYRSFFWPVVILGVGVIWLLSNLKMIPTSNLWILFQLWPALIIMAGLDILFARRLPLIGALLGLLVVGGVVYILLNGSTLGLDKEYEPRTETFTVEAGEATSVDLDLDLSTQETFINALEESTNLLEAEIGHVGEVEFTVTGTEEKFIDLRQVSIDSWFYWALPGVEGEKLTWEVYLSPDVPFDLDVDAGTGRSELDLSGVQLDQLRYDGGTGASTIILPASSEGYDTWVESGTGSMEIIFPAESSLMVRLDSGTGSVTLDVPEDAAVKLQVLDGGTGDLKLPDWIYKVSGQEGRDEGVYQTDGFDDAAYQLNIIIEDIGTGNILVR